ncbi:pirin family protein [Pollutibacter soli]|uniref:pirin family protein n=1 Tax=Pollutibacter soli TaxID=3034157 RepID=UPI0030141AB6
MANQRKIERLYTPTEQPGFLGAGHLARPVIQGSFAQTDPFIMLMDDILDKKDNEPAGGPHPHAGFETVTLLLEGSIGDENHKMKAGDFQMMTAGSGIIHTETIEEKTRMRLLQLWLTLPKKHRWTTPRVQDMFNEHVPVSNTGGVQLKLYSGSMSGLQSPVKNYVPVIIAEVNMQPGSESKLDIPSNFNAFIYVLQGEVSIGDEKRLVKQDQVGWFDIQYGSQLSEIKVQAGITGSRFVLYAAQPQGDAIVSHGPFIGDSSEDIVRLYKEFRQGKMQHISTVDEELKMKY